MQLKLSTKKWITEITTALLVLLFLYTAITKLKDADGFISAMRHNQVTGPYAHILWWLIPSIELIIVVLLFIPVLRRTGLLLSSILMSSFTLYIAYLLAHFSTLPCTCGGILTQLGWKEHLWLNSSLTLLSLTAFLVYPKQTVATNRRSRTPEKNSRQPIHHF